MKKIVVFALFSLLAGALFAQKDTFAPHNPITMAQGNAFVANASGYNAFFFNPAGFARKSQFTLLSFNVYGVMDREIFKMVADKYNENATSIKSVSGNRSGGSDASSVLPQAEVDAASAAAGDVGAYFASAEASAPGSVGDAINALAASGNYGSTLAAIDPANPPDSQEELLAILGPAILDDPALLSELLNAILSEVETASGVSAAAARAAAQLLESSMVALFESFDKKYPTGNANVGGQLGIGYVGDGLGIGFFAGVDASLYKPKGESSRKATGRILNTFTLVGGAGFNIVEGFSVGISLRPTILGYVNYSAAKILADVIPRAASGSLPNMMPYLLSDGIYKGFTVGVDIGTLIDIGPFTFGAAIKDLLPVPVTYKQYTGDGAFDQYLGSLVDFKNAVQFQDSYQIPGLKINVGLMFHPDLGSFSKLVDFRAEVDFNDILAIVRWEVDKAAETKNALGELNYWRHINVGAEIGLLNFLAIRGGFTDGSWTGGVGIRLFVVDINVAFSAKYGDQASGITDFDEVGFSFELAILRL